MSRCDEIQELLSHGPGAVRSDPEAIAHIEDCPDCGAVLEALAQLDDALAELTPAPLPAGLLERTLAAVEADQAALAAEVEPEGAVATAEPEGAEIAADQVADAVAAEPDGAQVAGTPPFGMADPVARAANGEAGQNPARFHRLRRAGGWLRRSAGGGWRRPALSAALLLGGVGLISFSRVASRVPQLFNAANSEIGRVTSGYVARDDDAGGQGGLGWFSGGDGDGVAQEELAIQDRFVQLQVPAAPAEAPPAEAPAAAGPAPTQPSRWIEDVSTELVLPRSQQQLQAMGYIGSEESFREGLGEAELERSTRDSYRRNEDTRGEQRQRLQEQVEQTTVLGLIGSTGSDSIVLEDLLEMDEEADEIALRPRDGRSQVAARRRSEEAGGRGPQATPAPTGPTNGPVILAPEFERQVAERLPADAPAQLAQGLERRSETGTATVDDGRFHQDELNGDDGEGKPTATSGTTRDGQQSRWEAGFWDVESGMGAFAQEGDQPALNAATAFLAERTRMEDLEFKEAAGYWAPTYLPGDPQRRRLERALAGSEDPWQQARMEQLAARPQPFDPPEDSALSVYLSSDLPAASGPTRALVQVGIAAGDQRGGLRAPMNLSVVVDLRETASAEQLDLLRATLEALSEARMPGDNFSLIAAGSAGGLAVPAEEFRYGPLTVAVDRLARGEGGASHDLVDAVELAIEQVGTVDDPGSPLGTSGILVLAPHGLGHEARELYGLAHQAASTGMPLSVAALVDAGQSAYAAELDQLALEGQGTRHDLAVAGEARSLVDRQLAAVSSVIARAVRLRIQLAPGVELVDVLGSYRLDEQSADRVRESERAVDLRLSRNLGIEADRGEDEDGIQIVIPAWHAGDDHVILLDVVVPGPGPVAEVGLRYKDLVHPANRTARASLALGRSGRAGPIHQRVLANYLARRVATELHAAAREVARDQRHDAFHRLYTLLDLLDGLPQLRPEFAGDPDLLTDRAAVVAYLETLQEWAYNPVDLANSLNYGGFLRLDGPPLEAP